MRVVTIISEKIENLIKNKEISQEEVQNLLTRFCKNDWGVLDNEEKEEQNELLIEGVASGKCGFTTLRAFSPLIPMVYRLFIYLMAYVIL